MSIIVPWAFIKTTILDMVRTKASDNQNRDWGEASSIARAGSKYQKPEEIPSCKRKHDLMTSWSQIFSPVANVPGLKHICVFTNYQS